MSLRKVIEDVFDKYYYEHHDFAILKEHLTQILTREKLDTFSNLKLTLLEAIDYRLEHVGIKENELGSLHRKDELSRFRKHLKGLMFKSEE